MKSPTSNPRTPPISAVRIRSLLLSSPLLGALSPYLLAQRWFAGKARTITRIRGLDALPVDASRVNWLLILRAHYDEGPNEQYVLPLSLQGPGLVVATGHAGRDTIPVYDGIARREVHNALLILMARQHRIPGAAGTLVGVRGRALSPRDVRNGVPASLACRPLGIEQSNTSLRYGQKLILKLYRKVEPGIQPEIEISHFLTKTAHFAHTPSFAGALHYRHRTGREFALGMLQTYIPNQGDLWSHTLVLLSAFIDRVTRSGALDRPPPVRSPLHAAFDPSIEILHADLIGNEALTIARVLGRRTADLHRALATPSANRAFTPQASTLSYRRALAARHTASIDATFAALQRALNHLPRGMHSLAQDALSLRETCMALSDRILSAPSRMKRIRCHGDFHLGQVLLRRRDLVIIDFEGEPGVSLSRRRNRHPPLRDIAGMVRSLHYAASAASRSRMQEHDVTEPVEHTWTDYWYSAVATQFLRHYFGGIRAHPILDAPISDMSLWLDAFLMEKVLYEIRYELNNRPSWLPIPLAGLRSLLPSPTTTGIS